MLFGLSGVAGVGSSAQAPAGLQTGLLNTSQRIHQALLELVDLPTAIARLRRLIPVVDAGQPLESVAAARQLDLLAEHVELLRFMSSTRSYWLLSQSMTESASCSVCAVRNCRFRLSDSRQLVSSETLLAFVVVRQRGGRSGSTTSDLAAGVARDLVHRVEERLHGFAAVVDADIGVHLGQADDRLDPGRVRVVVRAEHRVPARAAR